MTKALLQTAGAKTAENESLKSLTRARFSATVGWSAHSVHAAIRRGSIGQCLQKGTLGASLS
jgi:hypothetical protein